MLQHQLKNDSPECLLRKIVKLAEFLCLYYVKPWSKATLPFQAPIEDLNLYKTLLTNTKEHKSEGFGQLSQAVVGKFENHFWYLTKRLVVLWRFSDASAQQKQRIAKAMKRYDKEFSFKSAVQQMPLITPSTQLKDLIGPEPWLLFNLSTNSQCFCRNRLLSGRKIKTTFTSNHDFFI